jgi:MtN3 and saliva related transmembrane protein
MALHHLHKRKRAHQHKELYPSSNRTKRIVDTAVYVFGILTPLFTIPQVTKIWLTQNADGVSLLSWIVYSLAAVVWVIYGILHKEKPLVMMYSALIVLDLLIVIGVLIYR